MAIYDVAETDETNNIFGVFNFDFVRSSGGSTNIVATKETNSSFILTPNPTSDYISIQLPKLLENTTISIYDVSGIQVGNGLSTNQQTTTFDTSDLSNGIYICSVSDGTSIQTQKFSVVH